jgi:hypothetical protein
MIKDRCQILTWDMSIFIYVINTIDLFIRLIEDKYINAIQHYVIKFVNELRQVGGFPRGIATIYLKYC